MLLKQRRVWYLSTAWLLCFPAFAPAVTINVMGALGDLDGNGDGGAGEAAVLQAAVNYWQNRVTTGRNFTLTVVPMSLSGGTLGTGFTSAVDGSNIPTAGTVNIDNDGSSNWFVDPNPQDALEFLPDTTSDWRYTNGPVGSDLMSAVTHEIGHAMGWLCGGPCGFTNPLYDNLMNPAPGSFVSNGACASPFPLLSQAPLPGCVFLQDPAPPAPALSVSLRGDGLGGSGSSVVNELSHPGISGDLMIGFLSGRTRELPSPNDVNMFGHAYGDTFNMPPIANAGADVVAECSDVGGADVTVDAVASADPEGDALLFSWSCPGVALSDPNLADPTGFFLLDTTTTCRLEATDLATFASDGDTVDVTVEDTIAPDLTCPMDLTVECSQTGGSPSTDPDIASFLGGATAVDVCDASLSVSNDAPPFFVLGSTPVTFSVSDDSLNGSMCTAAVNVVDTTPPDISSVVASPNVLWPPNHKMVPVIIDVITTDVCDDSPSCEISSVTSNETINGLGDGNTEPDWMVTGPLALELRAERSGPGSGRVYTVEVTCSDASDNEASASVEVLVPHDRSKP